MDIGDGVVGGIGLDIDSRLGGGAAGIREVTIGNKDMHAADEAEALAEILVEYGVSDGDVLTGACHAISDVNAVATGLIAGYPADGYVAGAFDIQAMAPLAVVGGVLGDVFRFAHLKDDAGSSRALDGDVLGGDLEHRVEGSVTGIGGYRDARGEEELRIIGKGDRTDVVATRRYEQGLTIGGGVVQGVLKDGGVVTAKACIAKCEQTHRRSAGSGVDGAGGACARGGGGRGWTSGSSSGSGIRVQSTPATGDTGQ